MKLSKFLTESERRSQFLATGDAFDVVINEELALEFDVVYHNRDIALVEADEVAMAILEHCGCSFEEDLDEAEYQGRDVDLNKIMRGDKKKFKVYVKNPKTGNVKKVNFGHGGTSAKKAGQKTMRIRKNNPKARKSFRARHNCDNPGPKTKARYWSCRKW